jgi:hypothetical protein
MNAVYTCGTCLKGVCALGTGGAARSTLALTTCLPAKLSDQIMLAIALPPQAEGTGNITAHLLALRVLMRGGGVQPVQLSKREQDAMTRSAIETHHGIVPGGCAHTVNIGCAGNGDNQAEDY